MVEPYQFEPEYNEDDGRESVSDGESASDEESEQLERLQSNDWCVCGRCMIMETDAMCCCCKELEILKLKTSGKVSNAFNRQELNRSLSFFVYFDTFITQIVLYLI